MVEHQLVVNGSVGVPESRESKVDHKPARLGVRKRYNLAIPEDLFNEVEKLANERQTTVVDLLRRFIKLGLIAASIENTPKAGLFIHEDGTQREIILV